MAQMGKEGVRSASGLADERGHCQQERRQDADGPLDYASLYDQLTCGHTVNCEAELEELLG